jgi:beta-galactosidase
LSVQQPTPDTAVINSSFTLRPSATAAAAAADTAAGAGVGEFGGAHWFAQQEAESAAAAADTGGTGEGGGSHHAASAAAVDGCTNNASVTAPSSPEGEIQISSSITVTSSGVITVTWEVDATRALPARLPAGLKPSLPRVGLQALLPHSFEGVTWYGLGPHECYPDRKLSGLLQQHTM